MISVKFDRLFGLMSLILINISTSHPFDVYGDSDKGVPEWRGVPTATAHRSCAIIYGVFSSRHAFFGFCFVLKNC